MNMEQIEHQLCNQQSNDSENTHEQWYYKCKKAAHAQWRRSLTMEHLPISRCLTQHRLIYDRLRIKHIRTSGTTNSASLVFSHMIVKSWFILEYLIVYTIVASQ